MIFEPITSHALIGFAFGILVIACSWRDAPNRWAAIKFGAAASAAAGLLGMLMALALGRSFGQELMARKSMLGFAVAMALATLLVAVFHLIATRFEDDD